MAANAPFRTRAAVVAGEPAPWRRGLGRARSTFPRRGRAPPASPPRAIWRLETIRRVPGGKPQRQRASDSPLADHCAESGRRVYERARKAAAHVNKQRPQQSPQRTARAHLGVLPPPCGGGNSCGHGCAPTPQGIRGTIGKASAKKNRHRQSGGAVQNACILCCDSATEAERRMWQQGHGMTRASA